jgi:hypothetical protein
MESYGSKKITARWMHLPDIDITNIAHDKTKDLEPQFLHVKSHQNNQNASSSKLSYPAQLNIMADALATQQRITMTKPEIQVSHRHIHLKINDIFITRDSQRWLMETSGRIPIQKYYQDKYGWKKSTFDSIDWELQWQVLNSYDLNDQKRILKFVHGWLPTNSRLHRERQSPTPRCPLCHYIQEDEMHLFQCIHPMQRESVVEIQKFLIKESDIKSEYQNSIAKAVLGCINPTWQPNHDGNNICKITQEQDAIGWQQVYMGRITRAMTTLLSNSSEQEAGGRRPTKWPRRLLRIVWDTFLTLWSQRNQHVHGVTLTLKRKQQRKALSAQVSGCYQRMDMMKISDRDRVFTKTQAELLEENPQYIKAWVRLATRILRTCKKEQQQKKGQRTMMEQYFKWNPPEKNKEGTRRRKRKTAP